MKREKYTFAIMPSSGRRIRTFSFSISSLIIILVSFIIVISSSLAVGSMYAWKLYKKQKQIADGSIQKYEALCKELQELRKSYSDFASILGIEAGSPDNSESGKGGPETQELTDIPVKELSEDIMISDAVAEDLSPVLMEAASLKSDFKDLSRAIDDNMAQLGMIPSIWPIRVALGTRPWMSSKYGLRRSPFTRAWEMHEGIDIIAPLDTPIIATADGIISNMSSDRFLGNAVEIRHNGKFITLYGHLNAFAENIEIGAEIRRGDIIGYMGRTGRTTGCHVHYEVRVHGNPVNPADYILN